MQNCYHSAGEKIQVTEEMLSEYQTQIIEYSNFFLVRTTKFILNLGNKKIQTTLPKLRLLFKFRITIKKIHRILELKQEPFLKQYAKRNTDLQREAQKKGNEIKSILLNLNW